MSLNLRAAKDWIIYGHSGSDNNGNPFAYACLSEDQIKSVQADAFRAAADIADYELVPEATEAAQAQLIISTALRKVALHLEPDGPSWIPRPDPQPKEAA